jgi:hypothetical protein
LIARFEASFSSKIEAITYIYKIILYVKTNTTSENIGAPKLKHTVMLER